MSRAKSDGVGAMKEMRFDRWISLMLGALLVCFFFSSRRRHTRSVSAFLLNRSSDLIQGSNVPNPDEAVPSFVSGAMAKAGKGLLEGTLQAGTSAVSDKLLDLVGLGGKSAADKGKDTRDYLAAAFPELNAWERAGA